MPLAEAVACWPLVADGTLDSGRVGDVLGVDAQDGVAATNFLRAVEDYLDLDPHLAEVPTPDVGPAFP